MNLAVSSTIPFLRMKKQSARMTVQMLRAGFMQPWEYRAKWYNEDETTAKRMVMDEADTVEK